MSQYGGSAAALHRMITVHGTYQCGILTSVDSDEPMQPPFKLKNSKLISVSSLTVKEFSSD